MGNRLDIPAPTFHVLQEPGGYISEQGRANWCRTPDDEGAVQYREARRNSAQIRRSPSNLEAYPIT